MQSFLIFYDLAAFSRNFTCVFLNNKVQKILKIATCKNNQDYKKKTLEISELINGTI
jgi:hypothetical protein